MKKLLLLLIALVVGLAGQRASAYTVNITFDNGVGDVLNGDDTWNYFWNYGILGNPLTADADETVYLRIQYKIGYAVSSVELDGDALAGSVVNDEYCVSFTMPAHDVTVSITTEDISSPLPLTWNGNIGTTPTLTASDQPLVYYFTPEDDGLYRLVISNANVVGHFKPNNVPINDYNIYINLRANTTCHIDFRLAQGASAPQDFTFTIEKGIIRYTVHYDKNGEDATGLMGDDTFYSGETKNLSANRFQRAHYYYDGWGTTPDGGVAYTDGESVSDLTDVNGATVTLYAQWSNYAITLPQSLEHGSVTCDLEGATEGETVTLTVKPEYGYELETFTVMNGDAPVATTAGQNGTYTFVMPAAPVTVSATFIAIPYAINLPTELVGGTVTCDKATAIKGETVTLTVTPAAGYRFVKPSVTFSGSSIIPTTAGENGTYTFVMPPGPVNVSVTFTAIPYAITLPSGLVGGRVTCGQTTAIVGETVTLTVTPVAGYELGKLAVMNGDTPVATTAGENGTYTFAMPAAPVVVSASFTAIPFTITLPSGLVGGTVTCEQVTATVGETVTLTVTLDQYYELDEFAVMNGDTPVATTAGENGIYTFVMPPAPVTVSALFAATRNAITLPESTEHGTVTCDKAIGIVGETVTLTVKPDFRCGLLSLDVMNGTTPVATTDGGNGTYTFVMPRAPVTVNATFEVLGGTTVTYTVHTEQGNSQTEFQAYFSASGSITGNYPSASTPVTWTYGNTNELSFNLADGVTLNIKNTSNSQLAAANNTIGTNGNAALTLTSGSTNRIYHVTVYDRQGNIAQLDQGGRQVLNGGVSQMDYDENYEASVTYNVAEAFQFAKIELSYLETSLEYAEISGIDEVLIIPSFGGAYKPSPVVTWNGTVLTPDVDYSLSYSSSGTSGIYIVTATGMGNYSGSKSATYIVREPVLADFAQDDDGNYLITNEDDLDHLARYVRGGNDALGLTFRQTADITCTKQMNPIGFNTEDDSDIHRPFDGTYDGGGFTISGLSIYSDTYAGLFGYIEENSVIKNIRLASSTIAGRFKVGGIVGGNHMGIVRNCLVMSNVRISEVITTDWSYVIYEHGGIVGNNSGLIDGCVSAARILPVDDIHTGLYGGIAGSNHGSVTNCLFIGSRFLVGDAGGAIVGYQYNTQDWDRCNNYYTTEGFWGLGYTDANLNEYINCDFDGLRRARSITAGENMTLEVNDDVTVYDVSGITAYGHPIIKSKYSGTPALLYNGVLYSGATQDIDLNLGCSVPGMKADYFVNAGTLSGSENPYTLTMPDEDVVVNATLSRLTVTLAELLELNEGDEATIEDDLIVVAVVGTHAYATDGNDNWVRLDFNDATSVQTGMIISNAEGTITNLALAPTFTMSTFNQSGQVDNVNQYITSINLSTEFDMPDASQVVKFTGYYFGGKLRGYDNGKGQSLNLLTDFATPSFVEGKKYTVAAGIELAEPWSTPAPRRIIANDYDYDFQNLNAQVVSAEELIITAINDITAERNVASVKYINATGQESDRAFDGLNIVVITYNDGSQKTTKVVF